jgi:hypothetical protein
MSTYQFIVAISTVGLAAIVVFYGIYLITAGKLKWVEYQSIVGKIGIKVATNLGLKDLTSDEILAFESFVYRDLSHLERGARLAYVLLFLEKELLDAKFENNRLLITLTDKGIKVHEEVMLECEKRLMITPKTEIVWKDGEKKVIKKVEAEHTK